MAQESRPNAGEMPFLDHLEELRTRLFWCAGAFAIGLIAAFLLFTQVPGFDVISFLSRPILPYMHGQKLIYTHPGDAFQIVIDAAFVVAAVIAAPVMGYQLWRFFAPAMHPHEKRIVLPVVLGIVLLFVAGVALAFTLILPLTLKFLLGVETSSLTSMISASEYFGFAIYMCLAFGAVFELPIVILALTALGLVTPQFLARFRRYALVAGLVVGGFITPDPTSMFIIAAPLYVLYEVSIALSRVVYRRKLARDADDDVEEIQPPPPPSGPDGPRRLGAPA